MNQHPSIDASIATIGGRLRRFERRRARLQALRGLAESLGLYVLGLLVIVILEWLLPTRHVARVWLSGANLFVAGAWCIWRVGRPLLSRAPLSRVANWFELAAVGRYEERILTAVEMAGIRSAPGPGISQWMVDQTIRLAAEEMEKADPASLVDGRPVARAWKWTGTLVCALAVAMLIPGFPARLALAISPQAPSAVLSRIRLAVSPGNINVRQGERVEINASANLPVTEATLLVTWEDGFKETVSMSRAGSNVFTTALPAVNQGFRYRVLAQDAESLLYTVKVDLPPRIGRVTVSIEPPAYSLAAGRLVEGGNADFLEGSRLQVMAETAGGALRSAEWIPEEGPARSFRIEASRLSLELRPTNSIAYQIRLVGQNQLQSEPSQKWRLRMVADAPPSARLQVAGLTGRVIEPKEIIRCDAEAADDLGLKRVDLLVLNRENQADTRTLFDRNAHPAEAGARPPLQLKQSHNYNLSDANTAQGQEIQLLLVATDLKDQVTRSEPVSLAVGSQQKRLQAEAAARMQKLVSAAGGQIDQLRQTRASWLSLSRNLQPGADQSQHPALVLLRSRLNEFALEAGSIGKALVGDSETNGLPEARFMYRLGTTLSAWSVQHRDILLANAARFGTEPGTNRFEVFDRGRELFGRALNDLEEYRRVMAVLGGVFETEVLAADAEAAQGRYKRALPVIRGEVENPQAQGNAGLLATFYEGTDLNGKTIALKVGAAKVENGFAPGNRRENWSARFEGDLSLPESGEWTLACVADDGVRLSVDGKPLLPAAAWGHHSATEYRSDVRLETGWRPISIEYFQGSSDAKLQFLAGRKGQPLQEVPTAWLRPPSARQGGSTPPPVALAAAVKAAVNSRIQTSLAQPASVPPAVAPMTNFVNNENLPRLVREKSPVGTSLGTNLARFASWTPEDSRTAERQADDLTGFARAAQRILKEELEKVRWKYEGSEILKPVQLAIEELRELNQELWRLPHNPGKERTEPERMKIELAKLWEKELARSAGEAAHEFFEVAKQKDATLAERTTAMLAAAKTETDLQPAIERLGEALAKSSDRHQMAQEMDQRLNEISNRYREINELQERINREHIAAEAQRALPAAREFARAQNAGSDALAEKHQNLRTAVAQVERAQRVAGDYQGAEKLEALSGRTPSEARGREAAGELRNLAAQTDNNPPSLAQAIPPPMQQQAEALAQSKTESDAAAQQLSRPRLAMALEAARLYRQRDPKTAVAYDFLGQDLGQVLRQPSDVTAEEVRPLAERAAALAGQKGEEARQAEIRAAGERLRQMAQGQPRDAQALATRLDELSAEAMQAAGNAPRQGPFRQQLDETSALAAPVPNWTESVEPAEIAASAAAESAAGIDSAPKAWESYQQASETLADAARQIRMDSALAQIGALTAYPLPPGEKAFAQDQQGSAVQEGPAPLAGTSGRAVIQMPPPGLDQAEWARLNERLRKAILSSGIEKFSEEQQTAIRAYFERLGSER